MTIVWLNHTVPVWNRWCISKAGTMISTDLNEGGGLNVHVIHSLDAAVAVEFVFTQVFPLALESKWVSCFVCLCRITCDGKLMLIDGISKEKKKRKNSWPTVNQEGEYNSML